MYSMWCICYEFDKKTPVGVIKTNQQKCRVRWSDCRLWALALDSNIRVQMYSNPFNPIQHKCLRCTLTHDATHTLTRARMNEKSFSFFCFVLSLFFILCARISSLHLEKSHNLIEIHVRYSFGWKTPFSSCVYLCVIMFCSEPPLP